MLNWGNFPTAQHIQILPVAWCDVIALPATDHKFLPHGQGRSYGDSCLNEGGILLETKKLDHFLFFDSQKGILRCASGVTLADILTLIVPQGWFLPVLPGTKFVSVGGAIANDIHGKNHHQTGTFGSNILQFELLRSNGQRMLCSPQQNADFFAATIGGLGLTGLILWAELKLQAIPSSFLTVESAIFRNCEEFFYLAQQKEQSHAYTVAWLDCQAKGKKFGRGVFISANHLEVNIPEQVMRKNKKTSKVPCYFPSFVLNSWSIAAFNNLYFQLAKRKSHAKEYYDKFFFPLDSILHWNKIYGKKGFLQYQFVLPGANQAILQQILAKIADSGLGSFLSVLKTFGHKSSPGLLSFPMPGVTLALDFPNRKAVFPLLDTLDKMVQAAGGKVYPAKDARMSAQMFKESYPQYQEFMRFIDPKFSSSFWRRVMEE
jgi:FAD/FMN-containing dehydrogenase